ncbi:MAG: UDP-N-acetylmuramoyl-L-alanyl-D-glutamate--2,6-diaminopimelate ligase [Bacteroidales bacterium]
MKKALEDILEDIEIVKSKGSLDKQVDDISFDSREVKPGSLFVAVRGLTVDGHDYIDHAVDKGASVVVCESLPAQLTEGISYVVVSDTAVALGRMASGFFGNPSDKLKLVGITGTNGKTTSATLLYHLFLQKGVKTGLISTIANYVDRERLPTKYTTPDALSINSLLKEMVDRECEYAFMEVSSHALKQKRISGLRFEGALFTNISHEHLDYHKTFSDYLHSKKMLFDDHLDRNSFALINADDRNGRYMVQNTIASVYTYGLKTFADFKGKVMEKHIDGTLLHINAHEIWTQFAGEFNASNLLGIYGAARLLGYDEALLLKNISKLQPVEGRFETFKSSNGKTAIVDYAHSPDALENVLATILGVQRKDQKLITVVGAGGDRDKAKRPQMAKIALQYSSKVVLTSDNPRTEVPENIIEDMREGIEKGDEQKVVSITDRKEAIKTACMMAGSGDIIFVAGKGHETYQEINGIRYHFDDREIIKEIFKNTKEK